MAIKAEENGYRSLMLDIHIVRQRCRLDRRRLEEGLLLYWSLNRVQEYELLQLNEMPIPADLNKLIAVISPLFHDGFIKKWINKLCLIKLKVNVIIFSYIIWQCVVFYLTYVQIMVIVFHFPGICPLLLINFSFEFVGLKLYYENWKVLYWYN